LPECSGLSTICGNGLCELEEIITRRCPQDCGGVSEGILPRIGICGDGICDCSETIIGDNGCPFDCGPLDSTCGDGFCIPPENFATCPDDCIS